MSEKKKLLIFSLSDISNDARVLKQVELFAEDCDITTCGFGPTPPNVTEHLRIPDEEASLKLDGRLITVKHYRAAFWTLPAIRAARKLLAGREGDFDLVFANEPHAAPFALRLKPNLGFHVDLHEYSPSLQEDHEAWNRRIKPFYEWLVRKYTTRGTSWSSPSEGVSRKYFEEFGFLPTTVTNATPLQDLEPRDMQGPIKFVHHGSAQRNRRPDLMIKAFMDSKVDGTFDLFLTPMDPTLVAELKEQARLDDRVRVHDGIPYRQLLARLNEFDVGVHLLPPSTYNHQWALPNKLFDFVQARLGQIIGPNPEMAETVEKYSLGQVTEGFSTEDLTNVFDAVTPEQVAEWKRNAHRYAEDLSAKPQVAKWKDAVDSIAKGPGNG